MACEDYPTKQTAKTFKLDAETVNEVVTSSDDRTNPASDGLTKKTLAGIENDATNQLSDIQQRADDQYSDINNQYVLRNKGDYVTDPLLEFYYEFADFNGLIYFPIVAPYQVDSTTYPDPSNDPNLRLGQATDDSLVTATGSTTPRRLDDRFADVVNLLDFGAVGDGVTDDSAAIQLALNSLTEGQKLISPSRTYRCSSEISRSFGRGSDRVIIELNGVFVFESSNGFHFKDVFDADIRLGVVAYLTDSIDDANASAGTGVTITSLWTSRVEIIKTVNFATGTKLVGGDLNPVSGNGMAFCDVIVRNASSPVVGGIGIEVTTIPSGTNPGYFNGNSIYAGFMRGETGLKFTKGSLQSDPFNGNFIDRPQIELCSEVGIDMEFCTSSTISWPRFEGSGEPNQYWILEREDSSRNDFYTTGAVVESKILLGGILSNRFGRMNSIGGGLVADMRFGGADNSDVTGDANELYIARTRGANTPNNTVYFGGIIGEYGGGRWNKFAGGVKDRDGNEKVFGLLDPIGQFTAIGASGLTEVPRGISYIELSTTGASDVNLIMPADREINGYTQMHLNITFFTNQIEISKSSGTVVINSGVISEAGLYLLVYRSDTWKVQKIGDKLLP
ncbi:pectin lyase fold/virulence factor [Vibrio phage 1.226.O._10N.261.48.E5]|nr:pectin lyase fold/virulence factor [Vibrio phage 1.226.O._10N.261.48.E5]